MIQTVRKIAFTMYPVKDMKHARQFYEGEIGLKMTSDIRGEWVEYDLAGVVDPEGNALTLHQITD